MFPRCDAWCSPARDGAGPGRDGTSPSPTVHWSLRVHRGVSAATFGPIVTKVVAGAFAAASQTSVAGDDRPFWHPDAGTPAERFELAKRTRPELVAFLRRFPKGADLHNHAGGAVYSDYVIDEARAKGLRYDPRSRGFTASEEEHTVSLDELEADSAMLKAFFETVSMRG